MTAVVAQRGDAALPAPVRSPLCGATGRHRLLHPHDQPRSRLARGTAPKPDSDHVVGLVEGSGRHPLQGPAGTRSQKGGS